jgi:hypothetical protein
VVILAIKTIKVYIFGNNKNLVFFINFLILFISLLIISIFLFFHLSSPYNNAFLFLSVLNFIINNSQLLLSTNIYDHVLLQNINAENNIEDRSYSSSNQIISINKNIIDNSDVVILGAWIPINSSISLEHLKGEEEQKKSNTDSS